MSQSGANAELIEQVLRSMGENISRNLEAAENQKLVRAKMASEAIERVKQFNSMKWQQRQRLLDNPKFAAQLVRDMDPETFLDPKKAKKITLEDMQNRINAVRTLGLPTDEEKQEDEKKQLELQTARDQFKISHLKTSIVADGYIPQGNIEQRVAQLVGSGAVTDPELARQTLNLDDNQFKEMVQRNAKVGPAYQSDLEREYVKWAVGPDLGLPMTAAEPLAKAMATGDFAALQKMSSYVDQANGRVVSIIPIATQRMQIDQQNAKTAHDTMVNNEATSRMTSAMQLAEKSNLTLDQSMQDVVAMRAGKKVPFPTDALAQHAMNDIAIQKQTIAMNEQKILDDKYGISKLQEVIKTQLEAWKETSTAGVGGFTTNAQKEDLKDKLNKNMELLNSAMAGRFGFKYEDWNNLHINFDNLFSGAWKRGKAAGDFTLDKFGDAFKAMDSVMSDYTKKALEAGQPTTTVGGVTTPTSMLRKETGPTSTPAQLEHTPEQKQILQNMADAFAHAAADPNVPAEQKKSMNDYFNNVFLPAYRDPSKFNTLFSGPYTPPEETPQAPQAPLEGEMP